MTMKRFPFSEPLVEVTRGSLTESVHRGHVAAVEGEGRLAAQLGSPETVTFIRSASKPQQAIPLVATGAAERFGLTDKEIAITCGSHNGEPVHTETVQSILSKIGLDASFLKCGTHEPYGKEAAERLRERGEQPTVLHHNCSGKHAGMLTLALHLGAPPDTYDRPEHPVQQMIMRTFAEFAGIALESLRFGTDGCGVPAFALPVRAMATAQARLVAPPEEFDAHVRDAARRIVSAIIEHPDMIEGDGELDTELMRAARGRLISKVGAEGIYTAGILPSEEWPRGLGVACKIEDGDQKERARPPVAVELLRQLGLLGEEELRGLARFRRSTVHNKRHEEVGEVLTCFELQRS